LKSKQWHSGNHAEEFEKKPLLRAAKRLFLCQLSSLLKYLRSVVGRISKSDSILAFTGFGGVYGEAMEVQL